GATSSFTRVTIERVARSGIGVVGGTTELRDVVVDGASASLDDNTGGLHVLAAARVDATNLSVEGATTHGVLVAQRSELSATGLFVRDPRPRGSTTIDGARADGVMIVQGSTLTLARGVVARVDTEGLAVYDAGSSADVRALIVRDVSAKRAGLGEGQGLAARFGARLVASAVLVEDATWRGVLVDNASALTLTSAHVRRTRSSPLEVPGGTGVVVASGSRAVLSRVVIEDSTNGGLQVDSAEATVTDLRISRVALDPFATGIELEGDGVRARGSRLALTRALVEDVAATGVRTFPTVAAPLALDDLTIRRSGLGGLRMKGSAAPVIRRISIEDTAEYGISVIRDAGEFIDRQEITAEDVVVRNVVGPRSPCPTCAPGVGVWAIDTGSIRLRSFEISGCASAGVLVTDQATVALSEGRVHGNGVGVRATSAPFDPTTLLDRVVFEDNGAELELAW
ncbi:right-handed parallel beta-helix repeat-containing protein, partial [Myxococcota bacterium]|nr:right-handed parallel beta-helix repeat-containing protein [Myxococcota bacterium]